MAGDGKRRRDLADRLRAADPRAVDIGVALLVQVAVTIPFVVPRAPEHPPATVPFYLAATLTVLPLVWRRRAPVTVMFAVLVAQSLYGVVVDGPGQPLPYTGLVALYTVAALSPARPRRAVAALMAVSVCVSVQLNTGTARELLFSLFVFCAAYAFGRLTHTRQAYARALEERAAQRERAHRIEAEQAAARERARIAREMHDVLAHAVSLMVVQAEAGPVAVRSAPERAEAAFEAISETGRDAMTQLRRMLGVLREDDAAGSSRTPQPVLADLPELLERAALGGPSVDHAVTGTPRPLPPAAETTVYRVVQEALTNAVRHARARTVRVRLAYEEDTVEITVTDDGRGPAGTGGGTSGGHGLVGIRERAAAHGGTARNGPGPDGTGFRVAVRLPLDRAAEAAR